MTIAMILVASVDTQLEAEILEAGPEYRHLHGLPKALLPITGGRRVIDYWWGAIEKLRKITDVYLVTNAKHFKHFERWATARGIPVSHVVNDGSTMRTTAIGACRDLLLGLSRASWFKDQNREVMVIAGDSLFHREFDLQAIVTESHVLRGDSLVVSYNLGPDEDAASRGIIEVDPETRMVTRFVEKPNNYVAGQACPLFYILQPVVVKCLPEFKTGSLGNFMEWVVNAKRLPVYSMRMPGVFRLIGNAGLREYLDLVERFERVDGPWALTTTARARVGLFGNPSDGYNGKTIALTIANFWASATIAPSERLALIPHPLFDPCDFGSLSDLHFISLREGYQGGMRLLQAACKRFHEFCMERGVALPKRNFTLSYETNVPRQVGLAGSSAIVTAAIRALMRFYNLDDSHIKEPWLPSLVLSVEAELGIVAGLQDRVVQAYEGLVYMDFDAKHFQDKGYGRYERLDPSNLQAALPILWLAYCGEPSDSGRIHSDVKSRFQAGDETVHRAMRDLARVAETAKTAIESGDKDECKRLLALNFSLRRKLFGDDVLGQANLRLVEIAESLGGVAKLPGSGGAVVGTCEPDQLDDIRAAYEDEAFVFVLIEPYFGADDHHLFDAPPGPDDAPSAVQPISRSNSFVPAHHQVVNPAPASSSTSLLGGGAGGVAFSDPSPTE
ncbi:hypothetical protein CTAYLR_001732 [Chrysophaeum taylorii]|uniref:Glucuronokinase 1 n=1 Tax=Chrysophaeum taylorii TaxID=2483200 RepID=A0AAD7XL93_9STRA|nr:hypothetical protein CTAYLR_001732 [Chrysophaeum taylorii]